MRCAIDIDEDKPLVEQEVKAWGELQSMSEEPSYKETEIKEKTARDIFFGYKLAIDDVCMILDNLEVEEEITKEQSESIQGRIAGSLCELLFLILDQESIEAEKDSE